MVSNMRQTFAYHCPRARPGSARWREPIAVEVQPLKNYTPAEDYHQQYLDKFSGGYCHINRVQMERAARVRDPGAPDAQPQAQ